MIIMPHAQKEEKYLLLLLVQRLGAQDLAPLLAPGLEHAAARRSRHPRPEARGPRRAAAGAALGASEAGLGVGLDGQGGAGGGGGVGGGGWPARRGERDACGVRVVVEVERG